MNPNDLLDSITDIRQQMTRNRDPEKAALLGAQLADQVKELDILARDGKLPDNWGLNPRRPNPESVLATLFKHSMAWARERGCRDEEKMVDNMARLFAARMQANPNFDKDDFLASCAPE